MDIPNLFLAQDVSDARMENFRATTLEAALRQVGHLPRHWNILMMDRNTWLSNVWAWTH